MIQNVEHGRYDKAVGELEVKLQESTKAYNERQRLLQSLQQDEKKLGKRLEDAYAMAMEIFTEKKSLHDSLDAVLLFHKGLHKEVSNFTDEVVSVLAYNLIVPRSKSSFYTLL